MLKKIPPSSSLHVLLIQVHGWFSSQIWFHIVNFHLHTQTHMLTHYFPPPPYVIIVAHAV